MPSPPSKRVYSQFDTNENVRPLELQKHEGNEGQLVIDPVQLWVDPGFSCYAVEAVQVVRGDPLPTYRLFDGGELYAANCMTEDAIGWVKRQEWAEALDRIVIDIQATQHQAQRSVASVWAEAFPRLPVVMNYVQKLTGIDKVQSVVATRLSSRRRIAMHVSAIVSIGWVVGFMYRTFRSVTRGDCIYNRVAKASASREGAATGRAATATGRATRTPRAATVSAPRLPSLSTSR